MFHVDECGLILRTTALDDLHSMDGESSNLISINETIRRRRQKSFRHKIHEQALNGVNCLIGITFVHKKQKIAIQHAILRIMLNVIQPFDFNRAIIIGDDFNAFKRKMSIL